MYIEIPLEDVKSISLSETDDCYVVVEFRKRGTDYPATLSVPHSVTMVVKTEQELETKSENIRSGVLTLSY